MITEQMKANWEQQDKERLEDYLEVARKNGIPEQEIRAMFDKLKPQWDEMIENLDRSGLICNP